MPLPLVFPSTSTDNEFECVSDCMLNKCCFLCMYGLIYHAFIKLCVSIYPVCLVTVYIFISSVDLSELGLSIILCVFIYHRSSG